MAKRRRINLKFVVIGGLGLAFLLGTALVLRRYVFRPDPAKFVAASKESSARGDWEQATKDIGSAIRYSRGPDPSTWLMLAEILKHRTAEDFAEFNKQWAGAVNQALQIDPNNKVALRLMLDYYMDLVQIAGQRGAGYYEALQRYSDRLLAVDPQDKRAQFVSAYAVLDQRMNGIQITAERTSAAEQKVRDLLKADPADAEIAFLLARWQLTQLWERQREGDNKAARQRFAEVEAFVDQSLAVGKDNPLMHQRMAQALLFMSEIYTSIQDRATTAESNVNKEFASLSPELQAIGLKRLSYLRRAYDEMEQASTLVKPTDPRYVEIRSFYAKQLETPIGLVTPKMSKEEVAAVVTETSKRSEATYRDILAKMPGERRVKLSLAKSIARDPARREEALKMLDEPSPVNPDWIGVMGYFVKSSELETLIGASDIRLDLAETKPDKVDREPILARVQSDYEKIAASPGGETSSQALTVKGRLQMLRNEVVAASQTFQRAFSVFSGTPQDRADLQYHMARTYMATQQTGEAKKMLRDVVAQTPGHYLARLQLAELLLKEGNIKGNPPRFDDGAVTQLDAVERFIPANHPVLTRLRLMTVDRTKDTAKFKEQWAKIPETTAAERVDKARLAASMNDKPETIRLLEAVRAEKPDAIGIIQALAQAYVESEQKDKALAVIDAGIKANPNEKQLALMKQALGDPNEAMKGRFETINQIADPVRKELALAEYYKDTGEDAKMLEHLTAAEKLAPDNPRIMTAMYEQTIARKEWDKATVYLEKLARLNADGADGQIIRVRFALAQGNLDQAFDQAQKLTKSHGGFAQSWVLLGQTLQAQSKFEAAINAYQQALERQTENVEALRGLIETYYAMGQPGRPGNLVTGQKSAGARAYIEMGQRIFPQSQFFKELGLRWEMAYGDPEKAIAPRAQAVKDHPENPGTWFDLAVAYLAASEPKSADMSGGKPTTAPVAPEKSEADRMKYLKKGRDTLTAAVAKFPAEARLVGPLVDSHLKLKEIEQGEKVLTALLTRPEYKDKPEAISSYADFYTRANQPEKAEKVLRDAIKATPTNTMFQLRLATLLAQQGRIDDAVKALDTNLDNDFVVRQRVDVLINAGRIEEASTFIDSLLAKKPGHVFYVRLRANADLAMGKIEEVKKAAASILAADPNDVDGLYLRARSTLADPHGDLTTAVDDLNRVVTLQPNASQARVQLAGAYARRGMVDDAIRVLQATISLLPNDKQLRLQLLNLYATANPPRWFNAEALIKDSRQNPQFDNDIQFVHAEALMWLQRNEASRALELMKTVLEKDPKNLAFQNTYLSILANQKDYRTLFAEAQKVVTSNPELWWGYQFRGTARNGGQNDRKGALADFNLAIQAALKARDQAGFETTARAIATELGVNELRQAVAALKNLDSYWQLIVASQLQQAGDTAGAMATVEKILADPKLGPVELVNALNLGGAMYMTANPPNRPKAIEMHRRLIKEQPDNFGALNNLAYLLLEPGDTFAPSEAVIHSQRVLDLARRAGATDFLPLVQDTHAWALINSGKPEEGISILREALQKKRIAEGFYHLGEGYLRQQQPALLDAERAFLDARQELDDEARQGKKVDPELKGKIDRALDGVKQKKK